MILYVSVCLLFMFVYFIHVCLFCFRLIQIILQIYCLFRICSKHFQVSIYIFIKIFLRTREQEKKEVCFLFLIHSCLFFIFNSFMFVFFVVFVLVFRLWINSLGIPIRNLADDMRDGVVLLTVKEQSRTKQT